MDAWLDTAPCGYLAVDDDGLVREANATLEEMLGARRGALKARHIDRLLNAAGRIFYQTHIFPTLKLQGRLHEVYVSMRDEAGADVPVLLNGVRRAREDRFLTEWVVVPMRQRHELEDEMLKARRAAEEASRARDEFLAVVSHELRAPLSSITGWAYLLHTDSLDEATRRRALQAIERGAQQQAKLVDDLLDYGRIVGGKVRVELRPMDPAPVVQRAVESVQAAARAKGVRMEVSLPPAVGRVAGDADRLLQVGWNLLTNAIKFTPAGGRVEIGLARVDSSLELTVADTGIGIAPDFLPFVFDRFRQASEGPSRASEGLGLGLSISKHLVELHGGSVRATSAGLGLGSAFIVRLPLLAADAGVAEAIAEAGDAEALPVPTLARLRVLVVDDDADSRELLQALLTRRGAHVELAGGVREAISLYQRQPPDVLVSDIRMEGGDGHALVRRIREIEGEEGRHTPALALSARAGAADRLRALSAGFQLFLPKPVDPRELLAAVANLGLIYPVSPARQVS